MRLREINNRDGHFKFNFNLFKVKFGGAPATEGRPAVHAALRQSRSLAGYYGVLCCHVTGGHHAVPPPLEAVASCSLVLTVLAGFRAASRCHWQCRRRFPRELEL